MMNWFYRWLARDFLKLINKGVFTMQEVIDFQTALDALVAREAAAKLAAQTAADAALAAMTAERDAARQALVDATAKLNATP